MRQDQFEKLQELHVDLTDVFLDEADPKGWPGAGLALASMDKPTRGDRYWSKKNAAATIALMQRIQGLVDIIRQRSSEGDDAPAAVTEPEEDLDAEINSAEQDAERMLAAALKRAKAPAHGKT